MISIQDFEDMATELARVNQLTLATALHYMSLIGDTPELDGKGKVVVREHGDEIARVVIAEYA